MLDVGMHVATSDGSRFNRRRRWRFLVHGSRFVFN